MIKLYTGPMKSGKSAHLINDTKDIINNSTLAFKPVTDTRTKGRIKSRNGSSIFAHEVKSFNDINIYIDHMYLNVENVIIDELQFLCECGLKEFIIKCKRNNINVFAAGLNLSSELEAFETVGKFMCYCDEIEIIKGTCEKCKSEASLSEFILYKKTEEFVVGDDAYISVCDTCHNLI